MQESLRRGRANKILRDLRRDWWLYLMLLPGIAYITIFKYVPMYGVTIAFKNYSIFKGFAGSPWVGMEIFEKLFAKSAFHRALTNNIIISLEKLFCGFPTPIILSLMINEIRRSKVKKGIQTAIILPNFISWIVINGLLYALFNVSTGAVPGMLRQLGSTSIPDVLSDKEHFRLFILITYLWRSGGYGTIIYLSAIAGIDQELYEAAAIDGAGRWKQTLHVTIPGLIPTVVLLSTLAMGNVLNAGFDQVFNMYNQLVISSADIIDTYVYRIGITNMQFSLGTAAGLFKSVVSLILVVISYSLAYKFADYSIF